jgi:hypothetical protein
MGRGLNEVLSLLGGNEEKHVTVRLAIVFSHFDFNRLFKNKKQKPLISLVYAFYS